MLSYCSFKHLCWIEFCESRSAVLTNVKFLSSRVARRGRFYVRHEICVLSSRAQFTWGGISHIPNQVHAWLFCTDHPANRHARNWLSPFLSKRDTKCAKPIETTSFILGVYLDIRCYVLNRTCFIMPLCSVSMCLCCSMLSCSILSVTILAIVRIPWAVIIFLIGMALRNVRYYKQNSRLVHTRVAVCLLCVDRGLWCGWSCRFVWTPKWKTLSHAEHN